MAYKIQKRKQRRKTSTTSLCSGHSVSTLFLFAFPLVFLATLAYIYRKYEGLKWRKKTESSSWSNYIQSKILNDEEPSIYIQLLTVINEDLLCINELIVYQISFIKTKTELLIFSIDLIQLSFLILCVLVAVIILIKLLSLFQKSNRQTNKAKKSKASNSNSYSRDLKLIDYHSDDDEQSRANIVYSREPTSYFSRLCVLGFVMFLISLPWEYVRLYQMEVAKRMATIQQGAPAECIPQSMGLYQSLKYWLQWHFSWQTDPCEQFHRALIVDPLWEVPPMMVLSTAASRCLLHPLELLCGGVGRSLRVFFSEIPVQWQPLLMLSVVLIIVLILVMSCRYRIAFPLLIRIEPRTPVTSHTKQCSEQTNGAQPNVSACGEPLKGRLAF